MLDFVFAFIGAVLIVVSLQDAFEVMLVPRRVQRRYRLTRYYFAWSWGVWVRIARKLQRPERREQFLSSYGALSMVVLFATWALTLIIGFALLEWGLEYEHHPLVTMPEHLYLSGATFFTLGYGDVVPHSTGARIAAIIEAGTGFGFMAVVIGYLPVLYQLFSRRESHVIQLDARAGSPPNAVTIIRRHADGGQFRRLDRLLEDWEGWSSDLLESHLSYPMLVYYRSQHDDQSWLAALTAIIDCCALVLVGTENISPVQAGMTFAVARQVLVEMSRSFDVAPSSYAGGDRLAHEDYLMLETQLREVGVEWSGGEGSERTLAALRATYEPLLDGLARYLVLPLPGWMAESSSVDHWAGGHRGMLAWHLLDGLGNTPHEEPRWKRFGRSLNIDHIKTDSRDQDN